MAEVAAVFHWPPHVLDAFDLVELIEWRNRAVEIWNQMNTPQK